MAERCQRCELLRGDRVCARCLRGGYCSDRCAREDWEGGHVTVCEKRSRPLEAGEEETDLCEQLERLGLVRRRVEEPVDIGTEYLRLRDERPAIPAPSRLDTPLPEARLREDRYWVDGQKAGESVARLVYELMPVSKAVRSPNNYSGLLSLRVRQLAALVWDGYTLMGQDWAMVRATSAFTQFHIWRATDGAGLEPVRTRVTLAWTGALGVPVVMRQDLVYRRDGWPQDTVGLLTLATELDALKRETARTQATGEDALSDVKDVGLNGYAVQLAASALALESGGEWVVRELRVLELPHLGTDPATAKPKRAERTWRMHEAPDLRGAARRMLEAATQRAPVGEDEMYNT